MRKLPNEIDLYIKEIQKNYSNLEIINLTNIELGESEFKLFNKMKDINTNTNNENNILLSNDADVIIMGLSILNNYNIFICNYNNNIYKEINLNKLLNELNNNKYNISNLDYTLLLLLLGNDYIPKLKFININKIIDIYHEIKKIYNDDKLILKENNKLKINFKLFSKILLRFYINNKKFKIKKLNELNELNFNLINNYIEGLIWCINDYHNTYSENQYYMFNYKKLGIDPSEFIYFLLLKNKEIIHYPVNNIKININLNIYLAIVLPYKMNFLMKNDYSKKILNNHKEFYSEELCDICNNYNSELHKLYGSLNYYKYNSNDENKNKIQNNIQNCIKLMNEHKKNTHKKINYKNVIKIINFLSSIS